MTAAPEAPKDERRERRVMYCYGYAPHITKKAHFEESKCKLNGCIELPEAQASVFRASQAGEGA